MQKEKVLVINLYSEKYCDYQIQQFFIEGFLDKMRGQMSQGGTQI